MSIWPLHQLVLQAGYRIERGGTEAFPPQPQASRHLVSYCSTNSAYRCKIFKLCWELHNDQKQIQAFL